jgi:hypothetical protein
MNEKLESGPAEMPMNNKRRLKYLLAKYCSTWTSLFSIWLGSGPLQEAKKCSRGPRGRLSY